MRVVRGRRKRSSHVHRASEPMVQGGSAWMHLLQPTSGRWYNNFSRRLTSSSP